MFLSPVLHSPLSFYCRHAFFHVQMQGIRLRNWSLMSLRWNGFLHETLWNSIHSQLQMKRYVLRQIWNTKHEVETKKKKKKEQNNNTKSINIGLCCEQCIYPVWSQFSLDATTRVYKLIKLLFIFIRIYLIVLFMGCIFFRLVLFRYIFVNVDDDDDDVGDDTVALHRALYLSML